MARKKVTPAAEVEAPKVDPKEELRDFAGQIFCGRSDLIAIKGTFTGIVIKVSDDGTTSIGEVPMGAFQAAPRIYSSGNRGVYLNGKLTDPTEAGLAAGTRFQVGCNITAVKSKEW